MKIDKSCENCYFLYSQRDGRPGCQVINPGVTTDIDDPEDHRCPGWEYIGTKSLNLKRKKQAQEKDSLEEYSLVK